MKRLILGLPLTLALLTACGGPTSPTGTTQPTTNTPVATTQPTTINGTIAGYTGGTASIDLRNTTNATIATGSVSATGTFTLTLPSALAITPYLASTKETDFVPIGQYTCTGNFLISNPASKMFGLGSLYIGANPYTTVQTDYSSANQTTETASRFLWLYTDQATTVGGTQACTKTDIEAGEYSSTINVTFTMPLQVGWNLVREDASAARDDTKKAVSAQVAFATVNDQTSVWKIQVNAQPLGLKNEAVVTNALKDAPNLH